MVMVMGLGMDFGLNPERAIGLEISTGFAPDQSLSLEQEKITGIKTTLNKKVH